MTPPVAVIDTNVVVSGLLTGDHAAPTRRILDAMLSGRVTYLLSVPLLAEYREVLLRSSIQKRHGLSEHDIDVVLETVALYGVIRDPDPAGVPCPDPDDLHLWALLADHPHAVLVTGDRALLSAPPPSASVVTPATFASELEDLPSR